MDNFNKDDIIDVDFIEKESTVLPNETAVGNVYEQDNTNYNNTQNEYEQKYYSNVKVVKINPILGAILFIALCILGFMFIGVIAVIVLGVIGVSIIAHYVIKLLNKFKK